jgi:hypothetical protein
MKKLVKRLKVLFRYEMQLVENVTNDQQAIINVQFINKSTSESHNDVESGAGVRSRKKYNLIAFKK